MPVLRSLFGLTCVDEAMPGGTDKDCAAALESAECLRSAMEKAPALEIAAEKKYDNKPAPGPAPDPNPAPGPGFRR